MVDGATQPLDAELVAGLLDAAAYPDDASARDGVEEVQTHISRVFLTGARVYKLRKDVSLGFVDFASRAARNADCLREVELNRRLAPDVYLGVAALHARPGGTRVGRVSDSLTAADLEHCVVMRRLPERRDALSLLEAGALPRGVLARLAQALARFHERVRLHEPIEPERWYDAVASPSLDNYAVLAAAGRDIVGADDVARARERTRLALERARPRLIDRLARGRAVDGHGDLHLQHVWLERDDAAPLVIDCLEFSDELRRIDAASDVAFLAMDLDYRKRPELAERFLRLYASAADDYDLYGVVDLFRSYRAAVRAKVAVLAACEAEVPAEQRTGARRSARAHLELAERSVAREGTGLLVLLCGTVGSGKTTLAAALADALGGVAVASDRVRKRMAGLEPTERAAGPQAEVLYAPALTERVYAGLLARAEPVLRSGRPALLDATYPRAELRAAAWDWADAHGVRIVLVEARCSPAVTLERLAQREAEGSDPSDAGPDLYRELAPSFEPPAEWPGARRFAVDMGREDWPERAREVAERLAVLA